MRGLDLPSSLTSGKTCDLTPYYLQGHGPRDGVKLDEDGHFSGPGAVMTVRWDDRVYGPVEIGDPRILRLIATPTFDRLRRVHQAGPSAYAFPFKTVTRFEHSLGVYLLLRRLGASLREQVAGLLHDISHTAFSHAIDFIVTSEEQAHHESLKPTFLNRTDLRQALKPLGFMPKQFYDDEQYSLLERPLPTLCADRIDYFLRDGLTCGVLASSLVARVLADLRVIDGTIAFGDPELASEVTALYAEMNRDWWASPTEAYIYNEFARAAREAMQLGVLTHDDLLEDEPHVLERLRMAGSPKIDEILDRIFRFDATRVSGYRPRVIPKTRWLDPPVQHRGELLLLSQLA